VIDAVSARGLPKRALECAIEGRFRFISDLGGDFRDASRSPFERSRRHVKPPARQIRHGRLGEIAGKAFHKGGSGNAHFVGEIRDGPWMGNAAMQQCEARLKFREGDASNLEAVADHSFNLLVSIFGAMFAPKPFDVAKEMVRVTKPGGRIVMGNWIPNDPTFVSQVVKISSAFTPPPPEGFVSPMTWGVESNIIERFGQAGVPKENISMIQDTYYFASPEKSPLQFSELFERYYGPTMNAVEAAQKNGKAGELHSLLGELANAQNKSKDAGTLIPATFMRVTVYT
jgi:SAM-dependent methyltransferase